MSKETRILNRETYYPGTVVIEQGEDGTGAYYVESGKLEVYLKDGDGNEITVATLDPGAIVGEMALISDGKRTANVKVVEEAVLIQITAHDFQEKLNNTDKVFRTIMKVLVERLTNTNKFLLDAEPDVRALAEQVSVSVQKATALLAPEQKAAFREEVQPKLDELIRVLQKYQ